MPCVALDACECPCCFTVGVMLGALVVLTVGVVVDVVVDAAHAFIVSPCAMCAGHAGFAIVIVTWLW